MTYRGHVQNGMVVLDEAVVLPEGATVHINVVPPPLSEEDEQIPTLAERLANVIGKAQGLPPDASINHDHYLYGLPKK